jgi:hypothetical protein
MNGKRGTSLAPLGVLLLLALLTSSCGQQQPAAVSRSTAELYPASTVAPAIEPVVEPTKVLGPELVSSSTVTLTLTPGTQLGRVQGTELVSTSTAVLTLPPTATGGSTLPPGTRSNPIVIENQNPGTTDWLPGASFGARDQFSQIAGFADAVSVNAGDTIHFMVSTRTDGITYTLTIYRLGWYGGSGAREMLRVSGLTGQAQGYWDPWSKGVADCPTCQIDASTGLIDTHWRSSYALDVPQDWISGEYLAKLADARDHEAYIQFIVRQDQRPSDLLVQIPVNTYQAYNNWGGNSLYGPASDTPYAQDRAVKVSFNRPISQRYSRLDPGLVVRDIQTIRFLEKNGYDATYTTSVDVDAQPDSLQHHRAFISAGHDEYWTLAMRDAVTQARDAGLNLAFLGGNDIYWQARYEPDREGHPRRVLVVYRFASEDPLASTDPSHATVRWDAPPVNNPQNSLTGVVYGGEPSGGAVPWVVASTAPQVLLTGTGLKPGDQVPRLVGPECETYAHNGHQPPNLLIVAASPAKNLSGSPLTCNSTWYQAGSGAFVFDAGTNDWSFGLDDFGQAKPMIADPRMMKFMQNVLAAFGAQPATQALP